MRYAICDIEINVFKTLFEEGDGRAGDGTLSSSEGAVAETDATSRKSQGDTEAGGGEPFARARSHQLDEGVYLRRAHV